MSEVYGLVLATESYPRICVAEVRDGVVVTRMLRVTLYNDGTRIADPGPARKVVEVMDAHSVGGTRDMPAGYVRLIDATPRTRDEALAIAARCPKVFDSRLLGAGVAEQTIRDAIAEAQS